MSTGWAVRVDGLWLPKPISGHPGLELPNTRAGWRERPVPEGEYLRGYDQLALVAARTGLLPESRVTGLRRSARRNSPDAEREIVRAVAVRADLYAVFTRQASQRAKVRVTEAVGRARARQVLDLDSSVATWRLDRPERLADALDALLIASGELLTGGAAERVVACPGKDCGWLFVNASGRRRWCQMAVCGNRAKQAAFLSRHPGRGDD